MNFSYPIIAALFFYLYPTFVGRGVFSLIHILKNLIRRWRKTEYVHPHGLSYPLATYFILGIVTLFSTILFLHYGIGSIVSNIDFISLWKNTIIGLGLLAFIFNIILSPKDILSIKYLLPLGFSSILALIVYALWQYNSPYTFNWDVYEHQTLVNLMLNGTYSFVTANISDTFGFNGYSTLFHTIMATSQLFFGVEMFSYWQSMTLFHFMFVVFIAYLFGKEATNSRQVAVISALLSAFLFDSTVTFTSLFLIPQTFTAVCFMFIYTQLISEVKHKRLPAVWIVMVYCIFLLLSHYIIGSAAVAIYLFTYLYFRFYDVIVAKVHRFVVVEVGLFLGLLLVVFSSAFPLGFLNKGEGEFFTFNIISKFSIMQQTYGFMLIFFLPIGLSYVIKRKKEIPTLLMVIMLGIMVIVLSQLPYVLKFYVLGRFFVHLFMALGIFTLIRNIRTIVLLPVAYGILLTFLAVIFIANAAYWKNFLYYHDIMAHVSPYEVEAANYLRDRYGKDDILMISDPATQYILESISTVNSQGGAYADISTRNELHSASQTHNTDEIAKHLYNINDKVAPTQGKRLLVLSGRYFLWQSSTKENKQAIYFNIWYPADLTFENKKYIQNIASDPVRFTQVYQNPTLVIFEVNKVNTY